MVLTGERMILDRMKKETEIEHICRYQYAKQFVANKRVLDAACGTGYGTKILAECAEEVIGMDISSETIAYAIKNYKQVNTRYLIGSVECLPFEDQSFDAIVSFETIEHVNGIIQYSFLNEIKRVLKEDGILIMSTPNKKEFTDKRGGKHSEYHVKEFYLDEFRDFLKGSFNHVLLEKQFYAKSACIINETDTQAQITDFDDEGMYVIAIASDADVEKIGNKSFIMRYPQEYEQMNDFTQIFYSSVGEFNEENSQLAEINNNGESQIVSIQFDGIKCKQLRIDPMTGRGIICIEKMKIRLTDGNTVEIEDYASNAYKKENKILYFCDNDPQIFVELDDEKVIDSIEFGFKKIKAPNGLYGDDAIISILKESNGVLKRDNNNLKIKCDILEESNGEMQKQLNEIYNSKTWRLQQKLINVINKKGWKK